MVQTVVLICLMSQTPHECTKGTAVTVLYGARTKSLTDCGRNGFALWSASKQFDPKTVWPKVGCLAAEPQAID